MQKKTISREQLKIQLYTNIPNIVDKQIWIWGTGNTAQLYQEGMERLKEEGFFITGYIDNDVSKIGTTFNGKPIFSVEDVKEKDKICVLICSIQDQVIAEIGAQCDSMSVEWYTIDEVILKLHAKEVLACYDMLYDMRAKEVYAGVIWWRMTGEQVDFPRDLEQVYFVSEPFNVASKEEVFVDCGAWCGDSITAYIESRQGVFKKIIAFEPDEISYEELNHQVDVLTENYQFSTEQFETYNCGVGDSTRSGQFVRYEQNGGIGSKFVLAEGNASKGVVALDEFLQEPYSFLKADVESYEYQMLCGARKGIQKNKPMLAICIYHNAVDLYSIPLLIKEMNPDYKIAVYHHHKTMAETVLYAWI